jgi:hypothetical protein
MLPHVIALSSAAAREIRRFSAAGGVVVTDAEPAVFDQHGRRRSSPSLADLTGSKGPINIAPELLQATGGVDVKSLLQFRQLLESSGIYPIVSISLNDGTIATDISAHLFTSGKSLIIGLQRDGNSNTGSENVVLHLKHMSYVYDLRHSGPPRHGKLIQFTLDNVEPALIAITEEPIGSVSIKGPTKTRPGSAAEFSIFPPTSSPIKRVVHFEAVAPDGTIMPNYDGNITVLNKPAIWKLSVTSNDPSGNWTIRAVDVPGGQHLEFSLFVHNTLSIP